MLYGKFTERCRGERRTKLLTGHDLTRRAEALGISLSGLGTPYGGYDEAELQRRVIEAERALRDGRMWIVAVISACASVASALAALVAVLK